MTDIESADLLSEIADIIVHIVGRDPDGAFLYAEAEDAMIGISLFKDMGEFVQFYRSGYDLAMKVLDLWYAADEKKKWAALFLTIEGDRFDARFQYPEEWGDEDEFERRGLVVAAKYGNKPIHYPSLQEMD